jgi:hypothetical protein
MPQGACKLCLKVKPLLRSHLLPAAMYKYILDPKKKNDNPVVVGRKITATTSKQVVEYLLCASCEDLFNRNGERWMLKQVWNGRSFPLLDRLNLAHPHHVFPDVIDFSGLAVGIDTDSLGYFALSVLWRAAVRIWNTPFGGKTTLLELGVFEEPIRKFLLGESPFPDEIVVMVHVCTDRASHGSFYMPSRVQANPIPSFGFQTLGILFRIFVGNTIPENIRAFCCVKSEKKLIFQRDCSVKTIEAFRQLMATSRPAKNMKN